MMITMSYEQYFLFPFYLHSFRNFANGVIETQADFSGHTFRFLNPTLSPFEISQCQVCVKWQEVLWKVLALKPKYRARRGGTSHEQSVVPTCVHPHYVSKVHLGKLHGTTHHTCTFIHDIRFLSHQTWKCYISFITVINLMWDLLLASGYP